MLKPFYEKGKFDSFPNKGQVFEKYLTFSKSYLLEKYAEVLHTTDGEYYLSELE